MMLLGHSRNRPEAILGASGLPSIRTDACYHRSVPKPLTAASLHWSDPPLGDDKGIPGIERTHS